MEIIIFFAMIVIIFIIYSIPFLVLSGITIWAIKAKSMNVTFKIITILIILLCIFIIFININHEEANDLYIKMKGIHDNERLVGLTKEQVVEFLGEPERTHEYDEIDAKTYTYKAGCISQRLSLGKYTIWGWNHWYLLLVNFDETDKVESTLIKENLDVDY